jgi:hypothetical protein
MEEDETPDEVVDMIEKKLARIPMRIPDMAKK